MAALVKQKGWYYLQFYDRNRQPQQKRIPLKTQTKRVAEQLKRQYEDRYALKEYDPWSSTDPVGGMDQDTSAQAVVDDFLRAKAHRASETQRKYEKYLQAFLDSLPEDLSLENISGQHILRWLNSTKANDVTRKTYVRHLRVFFRYCVKRGLIRKDITAEVALRRVPGKFPRWLRPEEVKQLLNVIEQSGRVLWLKDIILFAVNTGMRRGEILSLRWSSIDLEHKKVTVANTDSFQTKSGKDRQIPLTETAYDLLIRLYKDRKDRDDLVFQHSKGKIDGHYLSHTFATYAEKAGLDNINFHGLRHTACSWLAMNGASVEAIRLFAGHSSIAVTEKYMHLSEDVFQSQVLGALNAVGPFTDGINGKSVPASESSISVMN